MSEAMVPMEGEVLPEFVWHEGSYAVGGPVSVGVGLPWVGIATPRTGAAGGKVAWAQLQAAGCAEGDPYAYGGELLDPVRLAGVGLLLLACHRVAYAVDDAYRAEGTRRIASREEADPDEEQAIEAAVLVLAEAPFPATYRERLRPVTQHHSMVIGPWALRVQRAPAPAVPDLPPWARLVGRLRTEPRVSRSSGRTYRKEIVDCAAPTVAEIERLALYLRDHGTKLGGAVAAWQRRFEPGGTGS